LAVMDDVWLTRAGILAELVSLPLIAPEIIGLERLRRAELLLEESMQRMLSRADYVLSATRGADRLLRAYPGWERLSVQVDIGIAFALALWWSLALFSASRLHWPWVAFPVLVICFLALQAASVVFVWAFQKWVLPRKWKIPPSWETPFFILFGLWFLLWMPGWILIATTSALTLFLLRQVLRPMARLMAGEERLRAVVFGTGVVLLIGGLLTQLAATF